MQDALDPDDESSSHIEDEQHANFLIAQDTHMLDSFSRTF